PLDEEAQRARVGIREALPRALRDAIAQGDGRNAVAGAKVQADQLLGQLADAVLIVRARWILFTGRLRDHWLAPDWASWVPLASLELRQRPRAGGLHAVDGAQIPPLAVDGLRGGHHHLLDPPGQ